MAASRRPSGRARRVLGRGSGPVHGWRHGLLLPGDVVGELGRPDLSAALLTARRDAFLAAALEELDA